MRKRFAPLIMGLTLLALIAAACGDNGTSSNDALKNLTGDIVADGSSTVFPITQAISEEFRKSASQVKVSVGTSGTGGGFKRFCNGETDISDASRPIKDEEKTLCTGKAIEYVELKIALDGISVVVNKANKFVDCLTTAELKKIWEPNSKINNWKDVRAGFPDKALKLFGPGTDSGTFDFFTEKINGTAKASRTDYTPSEDDNVLVQGVAGDTTGGYMAYFGFSYYEQNTDKLKVLGVDDGSGSGCITPSPDTINSGTYKPLSRPLFIYVKKASISKPQVKAFVTYYLDKVNGILADVGYVKLHTDDFTSTKQTWTTATA